MCNWRSATSKPEFVYTTYIETSAEKLWHALTDSEFTERYWFGGRLPSDWKAEPSFDIARNGKPIIKGKVLESDPPKRLAYTWDPRSTDAEPERTSRVTFDLEPRGTVKPKRVAHTRVPRS